MQRKKKNVFLLKNSTKASDDHSHLKMLIVLSIIIRQCNLHLFTDPLFQIVTLTHKIMELLGPLELLTATSTSVFQVRDLRLETSLLQQCINYKPYKLLSKILCSKKYKLLSKTLS